MGNISKNEYLDFISNVSYFPDGSMEKKNYEYFDLPLKEFLDAQLKMFDSQECRKVGGTLNYTAYFVAKFGGAVLTCKDGEGIHCAYVYAKDNEIYVCDPTIAVIDEDTARQRNFYFDIPLSKYRFGYERDQEYVINLDYGYQSKDKPMIDTLLQPKAFVKFSEANKIITESDRLKLLRFLKSEDDEFIK